MTPQTHEKLKSVTAKYEDLTRLVSDPSVQADPPTYRTHSKALAELEPLVEAYQKFLLVDAELKDALELAEGGDAEMKALAKEETSRLEKEGEALEETIKVLLIPKDPNDSRNVVLEIRAGT